MKSNQYKCAICKDVFEKGLSDQEAKEQFNKEFGDADKEDCDLVCDDCYKRYIMKNYHINKEPYKK